MTASAAQLGYGTLFEVETAAGSGTYFTLGEVTNVPPPNFKVDQVEVTHMTSPNRTKEFISGLGDPGDMTLELNWIPGGTTDQFVIAWRSSGETRSSRITYPGGVVKDTFGSFVLGFQPTVTVADKMSASLNLKVAGAVTRTP